MSVDDVKYVIRRRKRIYAELSTQKYIHRELAGTISEMLQHMPVVAVTGMRQTGKTTMLVKDPGLQDRPYLSLDDVATLKAAREDPTVLWEGREILTIDEAQRAPELFLAAKRSVDTDRRLGRFLLSGSSSFDLRGELAESLAGRAIYLNLLPMTRREISAATQKPPFLVSFMARPTLPVTSAAPLRDSEVMAGGLPPVLLHPSSSEVWFKGYEQQYVERDIRLIARVENTIGLRDLLRLAAMRTGQVLNINSLSRDAGLPVKTTHRYLSWIEDSFLIRRLQPFLKNRATRIKKAPKLIVCDSGLARYLSAIHDLRESPLRGHLYETYVAQNLLGILSAHDFGAELLHWRTQSGEEVDLVIESRSEVLAVEIKAASSWSQRDLRGLRAFLSVTPHCKAAILAYNGTEPLKLGDRLWAIPLGILLS